MTGIQNAMFTLLVPPANPLIWALPAEPEEPGNGGNGNGGNGAQPASRQQREQARSQQGGKR